VDQMEQILSIVKEKAKTQTIMLQGGN
jgi:hypothetical protein